MPTPRDKDKMWQEFSKQTGADRYTVSRKKGFVIALMCIAVISYYFFR